jgi:hypothetical protein
MSFHCTRWGASSPAREGKKDWNRVEDYWLYHLHVLMSQSLLDQGESEEETSKEEIRWKSILLVFVHEIWEYMPVLLSSIRHSW